MSSAVEVQKVEIPVTASLPMSDMVQSAFLGHIIQNEKIYVQVAHRVQSSWFSNSWHAKVYKLLQDEAKRIGRPPNKNELKESRALSLEDGPTQHKLKTTIEKATIDCGQIRWDAIRPDLTEWLQSKILQETLLKSSGMWNKGRWQEAARLMQGAVTEFHAASFEEGKEVNFADPAAWLVKQQLEKKDALPTGLPLLDAALLDGAQGGGLQRGDTTVVLAPSNTGKTTCLLTIARHNIMASKHVLLMTHEGRPEDIRNKLMKAMLDCSEEQMFELYKTPEGNQRLNWAANLISTYCTYIPYNKAGMKVEDVIPIIRRAQEDRIAKNGKGYDLLVVDYPAKLTTEQARGSLALRNVIEIVYDYYVQLALEYNFHSLLAIQTNREGSKINSGENTDMLLRMENVQEAWGPMTSASNVITLNRSEVFKQKNQIILYVCKSRSSETGRAIVCRSNFKNGLTHSSELGAVGYFGETVRNVDMFLRDPNQIGKMIPQNLISQNPVR